MVRPLFSVLVLAGMVNFPPSSWYGDSFWMLGNNLYNTPMFLLLGGSEQNQGLPCFSHCPASEGLKQHKELGSDRTRTADPNCLKGCRILNGIVWN